MSSSQKADICPYINNPDCGRPNKLTFHECREAYKTCWSYMCLKKVEEELRNGKQDTGKDPGHG